MEAIMADKAGDGGTGRGGKKDRERDRAPRRANANDGNNRVQEWGGSGDIRGTMDRVFCGLWWWSGAWG